MTSRRKSLLVCLHLSFLGLIYLPIASLAFTGCHEAPTEYRRPFHARSSCLSLSIADDDSLIASPRLTDSAPSWSSLQQELLGTPTGKRLQQKKEDHTHGIGPPHPKARLRLFDAHDVSDVKVILYRDDACWCPYCQKVWLLLEEKRIPYQVKTVPLNAYGDKPAWYTRLVDGGKLPAIEMNGELYTESLDIMKLLDATFADASHHPTMIPPDSEERIKKLLELQQELQRHWFLLVFYFVDEGAPLEEAKKQLTSTLQKVDQELASTPGPWFLGGEGPSLVDLDYIPQMERMIASCLYWKGFSIRDGNFPHVDRWLAAWEERPSYMATKSDYYTLIMSMPSQNGPGYSSKESREIASKIFGLNGAWRLPLDSSHESSDNDDDASFRHEAAYQLIENHEGIVSFASRGAGEPGRPSFHAELADPYSEPNEDYFGSVDICLRHVTNVLLHGVHEEKNATTSAIHDLCGQGGSGELRENWEEYEDDDGNPFYWSYETGDSTWTPPTKQLDTCLMYLRDRIGVPRDMSEGAAIECRAHLNWVIDVLGKSDS